MIKETLNTKISKKCDVLVCGGGIAGISAALASARQGKSVILLEKQYLLGGLATAGLITIYLPLCDGFGKQVSFGIAEELFRLSISLGAEAEYPENWLDSNEPSQRNEHTKRFQVRYNPNIFAILAEQLLLDEGVEILYGSYAVAADCKEDKINAVIVENKTGRFGIKADSFVDATGDCDIAYFAGAPTEKFGQGNVLAAWYYFLNENGYDLQSLGFADIPDDQKTADNTVPTLVNERFSGLCGDEISKMVVFSHKAVLDDVLKRRQNHSTIVPTSIATIPQLRMTRRIAGEYTLHSDEVHKFFEDSIGLVSDWRKRGPVYEVPFRTLYSGKIKNLITAGRVTSCTDSMWDVMRVIPCCAVTGEAAGIAAAMTNDFTTLNISDLQAKLKANGVRIHEKDL